LRRQFTDQLPRYISDHPSPRSWRELRAHRPSKRSHGKLAGISRLFKAGAMFFSPLTSPYVKTFLPSRVLPFTQRATHLPCPNKHLRSNSALKWTTPFCDNQNSLPRPRLLIIAVSHSRIQMPRALLVEFTHLETVGHGRRLQTSAPNSIVDWHSPNHKGCCHISFEGTLVPTNSQFSRTILFLYHW
jgi:hypothetical protein